MNSSMIFEFKTRDPDGKLIFDSAIENEHDLHKFELNQKSLL